MLPYFGRLFILLMGLIVPIKSLAQSLPVTSTDSLIRIDGDLSEGVWQRAGIATDFTQNFPNDTLPAYNRTEVRMSYDTHFLYLAVVCYDKNRDKPFVVTSLKRDFIWDTNDNFSAYIDPFGDRLNGFTFQLTPLGVEREGQIYNGEQVAPEWDNKWRSAVKVFADRWQGEMMIPLKSIRYRSGARYMLANFVRNDVKNNQRSAWRRVPVAQSPSSLAFADTIRFATPLPAPGPNLSIIPYLSGRFIDARNEGGKQTLTNGIGFDAKIGITPSLNLDLTVNPDFSQVEADQQVTNLSRFELFYPERRQFFIENQDLFANFGSSRSQPFFSRRIGIGRDTSTGVIVQNPLSYGVRLSGKVGKSWRVGLLNTQTASQSDKGISGENYTVGVVQRQVLGRSNLAAILVNRQSVSQPSDSSRFTRIGGLDYNLQTANNKWTGKLFYHQAIKPYKLTDARTYGANLGYTSRNFSAIGSYEYIGTNYLVNDIGYVPRLGYWRYEGETTTTFYVPGTRMVISHGTYLSSNLIQNADGRITDREANYGYSVQFRNTSDAYVGYFTGYTYLFFPYDPTNSNGLELGENTSYRVRGFFGHYGSDQRKRLNAQIDGNTGRYFNGTNTNLVATTQYRFQPYGTLSLSAEYNDIRLPEPYKSVRYLLLGPRAELTFSRKLFLTTFMQFNNQTNNVNLNARLQWRYAPVSDLFIVYQENYLPGSLASKNRAFVVKLSYWLNV
ncbi:DUF5916 domain-containing protein [Spirosoma fluviale]|uniref:DUF5916 domain-containing protein n=1 Tax=Spirosoma fluviale TaxID=1597977 RepID=A0A286G4N6_9BACT|nr:DUF5916 domain-containing protein [Spirosoma fluviale]SOD90453.1 hypothetical protein SAMN06269250_3427 [Spirosoma fluviale]